MWQRVSAWGAVMTIFPSRRLFQQWRRGILELRLGAEKRLASWGCHVRCHCFFLNYFFFSSAFHSLAIVQAHFMWLDWPMGCARWRRLSKSFSRWCSYHSAVTSMDCRRMSDDCWICALVVPILFVQQTHSSSLFKTKQIMPIFFGVFFELRELSASQGLLERSGNGVNFKARNQMLVASSWISQERASCEASEQDLLDWLEGNVVDGTPKPLKRIGRHRLIEAFKERQSAQNSESTWTERSTIHSARNILLSA